MRALVTGADGFVGALLVEKLHAAGHEVVAGLRPGPGAPTEAARRSTLPDVAVVDLELTDRDSVSKAVAGNLDVVFHLAAVSSGGDAHRDPALAWKVNALGTAMLVQILVEQPPRGASPLLFLASTGEVYGAGNEKPRVETDPPQPCSPYAASKLAAEVAVLEAYRRTGLGVLVARAFPHIGPGQDERFAIPAFVQRIRLARRLGAPVVTVGNLEPVRDFTHVSDVVDAYLLLAEAGEPGGIYNIASGRAVSIRDVFFLLTEAIGHRAIPEVDHALVRPADIPYLVGDSKKLRADTGWSPRFTLEQTIAEIVDAQTD